MQAVERGLLAATVADALAAAAPGAADRALGNLGWAEMLAAEPDDAVAIVFTALGRTNHASTAIDDVMVQALGFELRPDVAVVLPSFGTWQPPGRIQTEWCQATGLATARATTASELLVICDARLDACAVTLPRGDAEIRPVAGVDPDAGIQRVRAEQRVAMETRFDATVWDQAVAWGQRAVAHEIAGATRAMLDLAATHAMDRVQFGRPVAAFQAVRHRLADALVAIEALEATLSAAADEPGDLTAALAKATAGRTARTVAQHCQQVLAGVGFTTDHPFHRHLKRTMVLEGMFGSTDAIAVDLGRRLLATRRVPTLIDL